MTEKPYSERITDAVNAELARRDAEYERKMARKEDARQRVEEAYGPDSGGLSMSSLIKLMIGIVVFIYVFGMLYTIYRYINGEAI